MVSLPTWSVANLNIRYVLDLEETEIKLPVIIQMLIRSFLLFNRISIQLYLIHHFLLVFEKAHRE